MLHRFLPADPVPVAYRCGQLKHVRRILDLCPRKAKRSISLQVQMYLPCLPSLFITLRQERGCLII